MHRRSGVGVLLVLLLLITEVAVGSALSARTGMTAAQLGEVNHVPNAVLKETFSLARTDDLQRTFENLRLPVTEIEQYVRKAAFLSAEHESKHRVKIPLKLALWAVLLTPVFPVVRRGGMTPSARRWHSLVTVVLISVILGPESSPMSTIKDTIALYASKGIMFPPRTAVLTAFLTIVIFKPSFVVMNTVGIVFFLAFTDLAFDWTTDSIAPADPFRIFNRRKRSPEFPRSAARGRQRIFPPLFSRLPFFPRLCYSRRIIERKRTRAVPEWQTHQGPRPLRSSSAKRLSCRATRFSCTTMM